MPHEESEPYRVGKGKPPKEHQFKKGRPSPNPRGRPKGSTRESQLQKMLKKRIFVTGADGRRVRKPLEEVINHKLVETAAKGDFKAIKLINELVVMHDKYQLVRQPSPEEVREQVELEEKQRKINDDFQEMMIEHLEFLAELNRLGVLDGHDGKPGVASWVVDAAAERNPDAYWAKWRVDRNRQGAAAPSPSPGDLPVEMPGR